MAFKRSEKKWKNSHRSFSYSHERFKPSDWNSSSKLAENPRLVKENCINCHLSKIKQNDSRTSCAKRRSGRTSYRYRSYGGSISHSLLSTLKRGYSFKPQWVFFGRKVLSLVHRLSRGCTCIIIINLKPF